MSAVIIRKKDVERLGKEVLKEMNDFLHDEYILSEFEEMKKEQEKFLENFAFNHINTLHKQHKITDEKREELSKPFPETLSNKKKDEYYSNLVKYVMKSDGVDTEGIYHTLNSLNLDMEIDEDLYFKTKAFLDIFRVFDVQYIYLDN